MKILLFLLLSVFLFLSAFAQDKQEYFKLTKDQTVQLNDSVSVSLKAGEIFTGFTDNNKKFIVFGRDTAIGWELEKLSEPPINYENLKFGFVKTSKELYDIDLNETKDQIGEDSIKLYNFDNSHIVPIKTKLKNSQNINQLGNFFRIVIPGAVTLVYYKDDPFNQKKPPFDPAQYQFEVSLDEQEVAILKNRTKAYWYYSKKDDLLSIIPFRDTVELVDNKKLIYSEGKWEIVQKSFLEEYWGYLIAGLCLILGVVGYIQYSRRGKTKKIPVKASFTGNSLSDFAGKHELKVEDLIKMNKKEFKGYDLNSPSSTQSKNVKKTLQRKELIVGFTYQKKETEEDKEIEVPEEKEPDNDLWGTTVGTGHPKHKDKDISIELPEDLKKFIQQTIEQTARDTQFKIDTLSNKLDSLKDNKNSKHLEEQVIDLKDQKAKLEADLAERTKQHQLVLETMNNTDSAKDEALKHLQDEVQTARNLVTDLETMVAPVEFLNSFSIRTLEFFKFLDGLEQESYKILNQDIEKKPNNLISETVRQIYQQFTDPAMHQKLYKWRYLMERIQKDKTISDTELIARMRSVKSEQEKEKEIARWIFKDLWEDYLSHLMIFCETMSKLEAIVGENSEFTRTVEKKYNSYVAELNAGIQNLLNHKINYVPLFADYRKYGFTKVSDDQPGKLYQKPANELLKRDEIVQVLYYGFQDLNGYEKETTRIIIKS